MDWTYFDLEEGTLREVPIAEREYILAKVAIPNARVDQYFVATPYHQWVELSRLAPTRARPDGIINSSVRMTEVIAGTRSPRPPLSIAKDIPSSRLLLLDGNSTFFCCRLAGFDAVPCSEA